MPRFHYKAKEGPGKIVDGVVDAETLDNAVNKIIQLRLTPIDIVLESQESRKIHPQIVSSSFKILKRISLSDICIFTRQMSDLVDASVPILRSLQIVSHQTQNTRLKEMVEKMFNDVKNGGSFSAALAQYPEIFSNLYINMVKTGEVSGKLEIVLNRLADHFEKEQETISKIKSSLAYPALILIVGIVTIFVLLTFVIPRLTVMFDDLNQSLPLPTLILVSLSNIFAQFWWAMLGVVLIAGIYLKQWIRSEKGHLWLDRLKLQAPLFGNFIKIVEVGRLTRTLGTLIDSGVTITTALKSVSGTVDNLILRDEIKRISEDVANGTSLKNALKNSVYFPEMAVNMISVGEETGHLERGLFKVAAVFEKQSDEIVKTMVSLLGPLVLVVIVAIVGFVVIAMLLPIFKMNLVVQ